MKTALVTGGAKGIGAAIVRKLCLDGFSVALDYNLSEERALSLSSDLVSEDFDVFALKCDVSSSSEVSKMIDIVKDRWGKIDVLVNNAGVELWGLFDEVSDTEWQKLIGANLTGAFNCCRAVLPSMINRKYGRIVNIASIWGQAGASCEVAYSASKAGIIGLTKALAKEAALSGITVNCVSPGAIKTDMMKRYTEQEIADFCEEIPVGFLGKPEDVAEAVAFFASEKNSYITGQVLGVNGGYI